MSNDNDPFIDKIRHQLDESVSGLDGETSSRLVSARSRALEGRRDSCRWLLPAAGTAVASMLLAVLLLQQQTVTNSVPSAGTLVALQDIEIMTAEEDINLFEELEFYYWLEEGAGNAG